MNKQTLISKVVMPYVSASSGFLTSILDSTPNFIAKKLLGEDKYQGSSEIKEIFANKKSFGWGYIAGQATQIYVVLDIISKTF
ncbi:MAG: hypothetical protein ABIB43_02195 [archaeon]